MKLYLVYHKEKLLKISCKLFFYKENAEVQFKLRVTLIFRSGSSSGKAEL